MKKKARHPKKVSPKPAGKRAARPRRRAAGFLRVPITNVHSGSDYSARILIGSQQIAANVILDTGSSTLAVVPSLYRAAQDRHMGPSSLAQRVKYGTGEWLGPVIKTSLVIGDPVGEAVSLKSAPMALTITRSKGEFSGVDGIMGLAYRSLNTAVNLRRHLAKKKVSPPVTFPWPFAPGDFATRWNHFAKLVAARDAFHAVVDPYFSELEAQGLTMNRFAFYTLRSWVRTAARSKSAIARDPMNNGLFILGGGEEQKGLYTGKFGNVAVLHDVYYNVNLLSVQVEGCAPIKAGRLQAAYRGDVSNCIVDTGTNALVLANDVCAGVLQSLEKLNPKFIAMIQLAGQGSIASSALDLAKWPSISFTLTGANGKPVKLSCSPHTYWQDNYPGRGRSVCQIRPTGQGNPVNQSVLGLPLMNNYYTVFDRSQGSGKGVISFAAIKRP
jgi:hypothetical protein